MAFDPGPKFDEKWIRLGESPGDVLYCCRSSDVIRWGWQRRVEHCVEHTANKAMHARELLRSRRGDGTLKDGAASAGYCDGNPASQTLRMPDTLPKGGTHGRDSSRINFAIYSFSSLSCMLAVMTSILQTISDAVLGSTSSLFKPPSQVPSYEDLHNGAQAIFIPQALPKGVSMYAVTPISPTLALTHRLHLESGKPKSGGGLEQLVGMGGMGGAQKDERSHRAYVGGFAKSHVFESVRIYARLRCSRVLPTTSAITFLRAAR